MPRPAEPVDRACASSRWIAYSLRDIHAARAGQPCHRALSREALVPSSRVDAAFLVRPRSVSCPAILSASKAGSGGAAFCLASSSSSASNSAATRFFAASASTDWRPSTLLAVDHRLLAARVPPARRRRTAPSSPTASVTSLLRRAASINGGRAGQCCRIHVHAVPRGARRVRHSLCRPVSLRCGLATPAFSIRASARVRSAFPIRSVVMTGSVDQDCFAMAKVWRSLLISGLSRARGGKGRGRGLTSRAASARLRARQMRAGRVDCSMSLATARMVPMANAIRALSMDAVQSARSPGHPGMPMGMADVATVPVE